MIIKITKYLWLFVAMFGFASCQQNPVFTIGGESVLKIWIADGEPDFLNLAVNDLVVDIAKITGQKPEIVKTQEECSGNCISIGTVSNAPMRASIPENRLKSLEGKWECYSLQTNGSQLTIAGSSARGTMFGVYYFLEKHLGVDPFYWWKEIEPKPQDQLTFENIDYLSEEPDFKFRGWFINDEDLLTEWKDGGGKRDLDYRFYHQVVHPDIASRVFEAAVRARFNLIIPASFVEIFNPAEEKLLELASARGLYLSQHHIEPLGVSAFGYFNYWKRKTGEKPLFSYYSEKEKVIEVWKESAKRWSKYPDVIWQIGLRGIADRPMWLADPGVPQTDAERAGIISDAMQTQMDILEELMPGKKQEVTTTLWGEGAVFNEQGLLKFPKNTTIIFADNSPGWVMPEDFYKTKREPHINYGIYYHHGLIGPGPHLAQGVPPSKTAEIFKLAKEKQSSYYAIMNVGNVREFTLGIAASRDMLEEIDEFDGNEWLKNWCAENFGKENGEMAFQAYKTYFSSYVEDDTHGTPLLLDGLSKGRASKNLSAILKVVSENGVEKKSEFKNRNDAFLKSLAKAHPGGGMSTEEWLVKSRQQDQVLKEALVLTEQALIKLAGQEEQYMRTNLLAHIKFMQCLTGWVVETTLALEALENQDLSSTEKHLKAALEKYKLYEEAIEIGTEEKWEDYYRGEKKINVKALKTRTEEVLEQVQLKL
ncbi:glycosyl hydrolase 115 family protein [Flexithrix dorotheae]|uniref:glycosyl hydrolase 115 family protein n=1 Tax=Flexithrix dorotheae TaxID=70993 RepID=UPI0003626265|nr:glycosyl hydrolase 115 family protein [Flexithrix dorotheae]